MSDADRRPYIYISLAQVQCIVQTFLPMWKNIGLTKETEKAIWRIESAHIERGEGGILLAVQ